VNTYFHSSTVFELRREHKKISLVTRQRSVLHQHKEAIADPAGFLSLKSSWTELGIVPAYGGLAQAALMRCSMA
jgi:hypothetical protein